ncbi:hypothetical protein, partial [Desulfovibrio sp.]|uniref:hypothetical protein n=1 Tax=Desulfovibrio sp. TaxID=885 RepID=UPI0030786198
PMAPLVSCMQLSSILGFIIRMSAWDGGEKVDFFAIASGQGTRMPQDAFWGEPMHVFLPAGQIPWNGIKN